ncbi:MAG: Na+/H+ antiporter NhaC family protein [Kiritimatiellae bacterium]|nr:Na+/H+ antiporter NhaC family protein [Kiritimatiellia bacterium]
MKHILVAAAALLAPVAFAEPDLSSVALATEAAPAATPAATVSVTVDDAQSVYNLAAIADEGDVKGAKAYIDAYADNVQNDPAFKANEAQALATIRTENRFFGTWWAIFPPLLAIFLALITKEVYSSLFIGIVSGGLLYSGFAFEGTMTHVMKDGFIASISDAYNIGILLFLVLLGALVAMMNKTGASAAFGRWTKGHIKTRIGAQIATIVLGMLIFVDDYFNCLTVGSVMRPVTDAKQVSRAKLAYLIDATAAPICIIAPISSWAAAVAGFAKGAGAESGFSLFISAIPYNFYAILTIVAMFALAFLKLDFGPMKRHEAAVVAGEPDLGAIEDATEALSKNERGRVIDLVIPVVVLIACCMVGMIYSGGYFGGDNAGNFVKAFSDSDASVGLVLGSIAAVVFAVVFYLCRRVITFRDCMDAFPEGFKAMVPAIMILCCAWTLKAMTDSLGAKVFISDIISGPAAWLLNFLPAIIFVIAIVLAFSTGTSWGTFGILIPIVLAAIPGSSMTIIAVSACMAGAVCGDHCSPISDTTIMASAGAQCNHIVHVNTQLPYALVVAAVSFVAYLIAPFVGTAWVSLPLAVLLMLAMLFFLRLVLKGSVDERSLPLVFRKFSQSVNDAALSKALSKMATDILADGRIDEREAAQLADMLKGMDGQSEFNQVLAEARSDGVITLEESAVLERFLRSAIGRKA